MPSNTPTRSQSTACPSRLIDLTAAMEYTDGDMRRLSELLNTFLAEHPRALAELEYAMRRDDTDQVRRAAHTMKSSLVAIGAAGVASVALKVENAARSKHAEALQTAFSMLYSRSQELLKVIEHLAAESPSKYVQ